MVKDRETRERPKKARRASVAPPPRSVSAAASSRAKPIPVKTSASNV